MAPNNTPDGQALDEQAVVHAIIEHHAHLAAGLDQQVDALVDDVDAGYLIRASRDRRTLLDYLRAEILPHARAEERTLYPAAAELAEGRLLVTGMVTEHEALASLIDELDRAETLVRAAAAAHAFANLFAAHLRKENDLVLPLLRAAPQVSLGRLLAGMHDILGAVHPEPPADSTAAAGDVSVNAAAVPGLDTRLDVRNLPHQQRHTLVLETVAALPPGRSIVLVADHPPRPVLAQIHDHFGDQIHEQWLQFGPEVWQVRLQRTTQPAMT